ncbi:cellulose binding domain-containing protein [Actinomadura formosensis]|uniref:cellulose binding domain-containing protein n=1 Tax=Actinomadura formosensis TaxID=60706 RepID=UPI0008341511|nr:cellulose binding domain-containing protein [Actinomadura formosensis]
MGRHTRHEQPDDEPLPGAPASQGSYYGAPADPSFEAFSGPTDDRVFVSSYERPRPGPPPAAERQHGPPGSSHFDPLPGDYPGDYPGAPAPAPENPPERPRDRPETESHAESSGGSGWTRLVSVLPLPLLPIVALVIAVGIVSYALSTQQISLNFAGGAPRETLSNPRDSQVSQRGPGERAGRGTGRADGLIIAFRVAAKTPGGFKATATIANKGHQPVSKWALAFKIPNASVTAVSGATVVRTGRVAFVRGQGGIVPGDTVRVVFTARGTASRPSACILNKLPCSLV